jgi:hypothetical protein
VAILTVFHPRALAIDATEAHARASGAPICVGFLYIRQCEDIRFSVRDLLEILVKQTIERHPAAIPLCHEFYAWHVHQQIEPSGQDLLGLLHRFATEVMAMTFYFLDAIDEASEEVQRQLLEGLSSLPNVKLFVTSRLDAPLTSLFPDAHHFSAVARDDDLEVYVRKQVSRSMDLQTIIAGESSGVEGKIASAIKAKCNGS